MFDFTHQIKRSAVKNVVNKAGGATGRLTREGKHEEAHMNTLLNKVFLPPSRAAGFDDSSVANKDTLGKM